MSTEVEKHNGGELQQREEPKTILQVIAQAAADPRVDVAKMSALLDLQVKMEARSAEVEFNEALARMLPKMPIVTKTGIIRDKQGNVRSRFATYENIMAQIKPLLVEEGFSLSFTSEVPAPGRITVIGTLRHRLGHKESSSFTVPTENPVIPGAQGVGAADSFCKRYIVVNTFNIVCEGQDTDGVEMKPITEQQVMTIETLMSDAKADRGGFLKYLGVESVPTILGKDFGRAVSALEDKIRKQGGR